MYDDLWIKVFETLGWEEDLNNLRKVNKNFNKLIKFKHLSGLKIIEENKYLLDYNFKNIRWLSCPNLGLTSLPALPLNKILDCEGNQLTSLPALPLNKELLCSHNLLI